MVTSAERADEVLAELRARLDRLRRLPHTHHDGVKLRRLLEELVVRLTIDFDEAPPQPAGPDPNPSADIGDQPDQITPTIARAG